MDALSPASCFRRAIQFAKAGYDKVRNTEGFAESVDYGARLIRLGRRVEAAVMEADPAAAEAVEDLSDEEEEEDELEDVGIVKGKGGNGKGGKGKGRKDTQEEGGESQDGSDDGEKNKKKKAVKSRFIRGPASEESKEKRATMIRIRVEFICAHLSGQPTSAQELVNWMSTGWSKAGSRPDIEDTALYQAGVGFGAPEAGGTSWEELLDGLGVNAVDDYQALMRSSLQLDRAKDYVKRDAQLISTTAQFGLAFYLQNVIVKLETLKCQSEFNLYQGTGANKRKFRHNLGVFEQQNPTLFEDMLIDAKEESVGEGGGNEEAFKAWSGQREKVISARNRLLKTYSLMGSAVILHPYFTVENLMTPSNTYAKVLEGVEDKDGEDTTSALGSSFAEHEGQNREILLALLDSLVEEENRRGVRDYCLKFLKAYPPFK
ncbi:hypothetical protein C8F01DRAFT_1249459 [Mycena amicta]|nr:hypothetical protein C8F01DRAFT_1249459 [Mycena amicta]